MLLNKDTFIFGKNVILIPYRKEHVPKYHEWMQSEELLELTASEKLTLEQEFDMQQTWLLSENNKARFLQASNEIDAMIGDVNLFLLDDNTAEAEIMIAEPEARGKRRGWEAILLMLRYGIEALEIKEYQVKIGMKNINSLNMFRKIGFVEVTRSDVFKEITLKRIFDEESLSWLLSETGDIRIKNTLKET